MRQPGQVQGEGERSLGALFLVLSRALSELIPYIAFSLKAWPVACCAAHAQDLAFCGQTSRLLIKSDSTTGPRKSQAGIECWSSPYGTSAGEGSGEQLEGMASHCLSCSHSESRAAMSRHEMQIDK